MYHYLKHWTSVSLCIFSHNTASLAVLTFTRVPRRPSPGPASQCKRALGIAMTPHTVLLLIKGAVVRQTTQFVDVGLVWCSSISCATGRAQSLSVRECGVSTREKRKAGSGGDTSWLMLWFKPPPHNQEHTPDRTGNQKYTMKNTGIIELPGLGDIRPPIPRSSLKALSYGQETQVHRQRTR